MCNNVKQMTPKNDLVEQSFSQEGVTRNVTRPLLVLVACEFSGTVRDAFTKLGHEAWSCDLLPTERPGKHIQCDVLEVLLGNSWDLLIAHPPCDYLCSSGMHWTTRGLRDPGLTEKALTFVRALLSAPVPRIALENPIGCISTRIRKPNQIIQPYQFGEDASKATCLWLKGLPQLQPTRFVEPRIANGKKRWANQTDSGQNRLGPSDSRAAVRATTYFGIADAMASQWGGQVS